MRFIVVRTSHGYLSDEDEHPRPCEGTYKRGRMWVMDVDDIEQLVELMEKEGEIIIRHTMSWESDERALAVEIYDGYRE